MVELTPAKRGYGERIIMIGEYRFPDGDAAAIRSMSLACAFRDLGYSVIVLAKGTLRDADFAADRGGYYIEGIEYRTMNPTPVRSWQRVFTPWRRILLLATYLKSMDLRGCRAVVINASDSARHLPFVLAFCRRRSIPLIGDVCEWYGTRQITGGYLNPFFLAFLAVFHLVLPRVQNMIVVSRLLEGRFSGNDRSVIRIAAPLDVQAVDAENRTPDDRLVLIYAGVAGRKDLLVEVLDALISLAPAERRRVELRLLGPTREDVVALLGGREKLLLDLDGSVKIYGKVSREDVLEALQEAHFSVLFRPDLRYAHAGFPSKVPESLAVGTPVLLNLTSDLAEFVGDGKASIVANSSAVADIALVIRRALNLSRPAYLEMRRAARQKAEEYFDYRTFLSALSGFMNRIQ